VRRASDRSNACDPEARPPTTSPMRAESGNDAALGTTSLGGSLSLEDQLAGEGSEEVLVFLFLPVLVFQAVLGLSTRSFFSNLAPVLALALVALGISTALVGVALHVGPDVHLAAALVFGSPISATDPVAVVAVFREVDVPRRLLTLVDVGGALGGDRLRGGVHARRPRVGLLGDDGHRRLRARARGLAASRASAEVRETWEQL